MPVAKVAKNNMNKSDLVDAIHSVTGGTKTSAEQAMEKIIESITSSLKRGEEVSISGLGIFVAKDRAARQARNPRTGEMVNVPAMKVPKFKPAKHLKDALK